MQNFNKYVELPKKLLTSKYLIFLENKGIDNLLQWYYYKY